LTNDPSSGNIYKLSARNASGAILENDTENEKQENSRFGRVEILFMLGTLARHGDEREGLNKRV
jgi:hypothetical protein